LEFLKFSKSRSDFDTGLGIGGCSTSLQEKIIRTVIGWLVFDDQLVRNLNFVEVLGTFLRDVSFE
jgi:hypothetical protein